MKLKQFNVFSNVAKNNATHSATLNTLKQAKKECRDWSKLTVAVADLASELKQEIAKSMGLPDVKDSSNGNPFVKLAHGHADNLDQISSSYKNVSDVFRGHKRQAAKQVFARRADTISGGVAATLGAGLAAFPISPWASKQSKDIALSQTNLLSKSILSTFDMEEIKSLDSQLSQIKDITNRYSSNVQTEKVNSLFNEIEALKAKLDTAEHSPFVHKMKAATQARAEIQESLVGKDREEVFSTLDSALNDLKQSESYKPIRSKKSKSDKTEVRAADIDHFFAKIEKRTIKANVRFEKTAMHKDSVSLGSPLRSHNTFWAV